MKKWVLALAVIILLSGLILLSNSNLAKEDRRTVDINSAAENWQVSAQYPSGDDVILGITKGENWDLIFADPSNSDLEVSFNITVEDPNGGHSLYQIFYVGPGPQYTPDPGSMDYPMTMTKVEHLAGDCLTGDPQIMSEELIKFGRAKEDGIFTVKILRETLWTSGTPESLTLYRELVKREFPQAYLFPWGLGLISVGTVTTFLGIMSSKPKKHKVKG